MFTFQFFFPLSVGYLISYTYKIQNTMATLHKFTKCIKISVCDSIYIYIYIYIYTHTFTLHLVIQQMLLSTEAF